MEKKLEEIIEKAWHDWRTADAKIERRSFITAEVDAILSSPDLVVVEREKLDRLIERVNDGDFDNLSEALADLKEGK